MRYLKEFWLFGLKQVYACMFGGFLLMLLSFVLVSLVHPVRIRREA